MDQSASICVICGFSRDVLAMKLRWSYYLTPKPKTFVLNEQSFTPQGVTLLPQPAFSSSAQVG